MAGSGLFTVGSDINTPSESALPLGLDDGLLVVSSAELLADLGFRGVLYSGHTSSVSYTHLTLPTNREV